MYPILKQREEQRRYLRKTLNARARVIIFSQALNLLEMGQATVRNISPVGVSISDLTVPSQSLPTAPFIVDLLIEEGPLSNIHMTCSMTRVNNDR